MHQGCEIGKREEEGEACPAERMGSSAAEVVLDLRLCSGRTVGGLLKDAAAKLVAGDGRAAKLEESVRSLEEERTKIEAFKRELPLCMLLLTDVIEGLKKELNRWRGERCVHAFEEFIPIRSKCDEEIGAMNDADCKEKMSWMTSAQLWSDSSSEERNDENRSISKERNERSDRQEEKENLFAESNSRGSALVPFGSSVPIVNSKEEMKPRVAPPEFSLVPAAVNNSFSPVSSGSDEHFSVCPASKGVSRAPVPAPASVGAHLSLRLQQQQQLPRKARRCWSQELHRKFVHALQQLGGAQVATPKQIRDLMKVDGLTNDEVKSHLQKYRLHTRKTPNVSATADRPIVDLGVLWVPPEDCTTSPQLSFSQSGSPQGPLQLAGSNRAISATAADSYEEEDEKSESYNWK